MIYLEGERSVCMHTIRVVLMPSRYFMRCYLTITQKGGSIEMNKRLSKIELNEDGTVKGLKFQDGEV
jgi:hypothetical protein